jgi:predicted NBD/HSP70 family sugar kinase
MRHGNLPQGYCFALHRKCCAWCLSSVKDDTAGIELRLRCSRTIRDRNKKDWHKVARINSALIRQINTARVFRALWDHPRISQRRLCLLTQLDASTVSAVIAGLEADGIVRRMGGQRSGTAGRPETLLEIVPEGGVLVGASIGSDHIRMLACGLSGERLGALQMETGRTVGDALGMLQRGVASLVSGLGLGLPDIKGIGVGQHGLVDRDGRLVLAPRQGWHDVAMGTRLRALFAAPVHLENDTKAAALAEYLFGACRGVADFVLIHGGSGLGGALYLHGELYHGAGLAGELGHMKVLPNGLPCGCGGKGCLEAYVSEPAIRTRLALLGFECANAADIAQAAGDNPAIRTVLDECGWMLGLATANLVNLLHPRRVVLAGSLATLSPFLLPQARAALAENALATMGKAVEFVVSTLGEDAVELGGVGLAMEGFLPIPAQLTPARR